jgi:hypothetical protein
MQVPEKNILQHDHDIIVIIQAGLPILYFCSLATTVYCTRQSAFLLNQSQNEMKSELLTDLLALHKIRKKVDATHT